MDELVRVLVVEDSPSDAELIEREAMKAIPGSVCLRVESRPAYLDALTTFRPDIILSDYQLPQFSGLQALGDALEKVPTTPFIIVTGSLNEETAVECMKAGAWDYILKGQLVRLGPALVASLERKRLQWEHRRTVESWRLARFCIDHASIAIFRISEEGGILEANSYACEALGYGSEELCAMGVFDIDPSFTLYRRIKTDDGGAFETKFLCKNGSMLQVEVTVNHFIFEGQSCCFSFARDITERKKSESELKKLSTIVEQSPASVLLTDPDGNIEYANPKFTELTGYALEEVRGKNPRLLKSGETSPEDYRKMWELLSAGQEWHGELRNRKKDGSFFWERVSISPIRDGEGAVTHYLAVKEDVTERKRYEEQLHYLATHDDLTGLANRILLHDRLDQSMRYADRSRKMLGLLLLDIDRFKVINDGLGHSAGDELLQGISQRLKSSVRELDTVARLGGDEFVVLLADVSREEDIGVISQKILGQISRPFQIGGREITVTASLGISVYPRDGNDGETLLRHADVAMYQAKEEGRNTYHFYAPGMALRVMETLEMEAALRRALERGELELHYQPKLNLKTGRIVGAEALLRWDHPVHGHIPPAVFIPLAEETGLILSIGDWVLTRVCEQLNAWRAAGLPLVAVAANVSARQFLEGDLASRVQKILERYAVTPAFLELELTESVLIRNPQSAAETLQQLRRLGVFLTLDDFGTGYSSLNYLRRFPVQCLKIDRSFIKDTDTDSTAVAVAASIVGIAHHLGLKAVAEGVETLDQLKFLRACGCDDYQGFYFSRAVPAADFAELCRKHAQGEHDRARAEIQSFP